MNDNKEADGTNNCDAGDDDGQEQLPGNGNNEDQNSSDSPESGHEVDADDDAVGDTAFSKHFLFTTLMNAIKLVNSETNGNSSEEQVIELDEQSEEELCILWDMSVNEDVISFLNENKAIDLFEAIIIKTNSPRFAEISAGILANIAVNPEICANIANRPQFRQLVIDSLSSSDIPFVIQMLRILSLSLSNNEVQSLWLSTIRDNSDQFFQTLQYSFENCLNCDLLKSELKLINKTLYLDDSIGQLWLSFDTRNECVKCLIDASNQLLTEDSENVELLDDVWLSVHSLSLLNNDFTETKLIAYRNELLDLFKRYIIDSFGESIDYIIPSTQRAGALSASITLINQILCLSTSAVLQSLFNDDLIQCLHHLQSNCLQYIEELGEESQDKPSFQLALDQLNAIIKIHHDHSRKVQEDSPHER